jgi:hypothetical protein
MTGGVCSATSSVQECLFFDIDVKGGERRVQNVSVTEESLNGQMQRRNVSVTEESLNGRMQRRVEV